MSLFPDTHAHTIGTTNVGACPIFDGKETLGVPVASCPWKDRLRSVHFRVLESLFLLILLDHS